MSDPFGELLARREVALRRRATIAAERLQLSVVPSYNTAPFIAETIRSILVQTVSDPRSSWSTTARPTNLATIDAIRDPRVTCAQQRNRGLAGAQHRYSAGACRNHRVLRCRRRLVSAQVERHLALMANAPHPG
jgi:hypothetical protein